MLVGKHPLHALLGLLITRTRAGRTAPALQLRDSNGTGDATLEEIEGERLSFQPISYTDFETPRMTRLGRRAVTGDTMLQDQSHLYYGPPEWKPNSDMRLAKVSVGGSDPNVKVLSEERFKDFIKNAVCATDTVTIDLHEDEQSFRSVREEWSWVNKETAHNVILIMENEECNAPDGDKTPRQPWLATQVQFDEAKNRIVLKATPRTFADAFGKNWSLGITRHQSSPSDRRRNLRKRLGGRIATIDLNHNFTGLGFQLPKDFASILTKDDPIGAIECSPCHTSGEIDFDVKLGWGDKGPKGSMTVFAHGVGASLTARLSVYQKLLSKSTGDHEIWGWVPPYAGIYIKGIADFGPTVKAIFSAGLNTNAEQAPAVLAMGYDLSIPDPSEFTVQLDMGGFHSKKVGWDPSFKQLPPGMTRDLSLEGRIGPKLGLSLDGSVLGQGVSVGFHFSAATINFNVTADSEKSVCTNPSFKKDDKGASFDIDLDQEVDAYQSAKFLFWEKTATQTLASTSYDLFSTCMPMITVTEIHTTMPSTSLNAYIPAPSKGGLEALAMQKASILSSVFATQVAPKVTEAFKDDTSEAKKIASTVTSEAKEDFVSATKVVESVASKVEHGAKDVADKVEDKAKDVGHGIMCFFSSKC